MNKTGEGFLLDITAPVEPDVREYLRGRLEMLRGFAGDRITGADEATLTNLLDENAPDGVARRADLFLLTASTVHTAEPAAVAVR